MNTLLLAAEKCGWGERLARVGGGVAGNARPVWNFKEFYAGACVMGIFDGDCSLGGGG
jgi:hypothetical protein